MTTHMAKIKNLAHQLTGETNIIIIRFEVRRKNWFLFIDVIENVCDWRLYVCCNYIRLAHMPSEWWEFQSIALRDKYKIIL